MLSEEELLGVLRSQNGDTQVVTLIYTPLTIACKNGLLHIIPLRQ